MTKSDLRYVILGGMPGPNSDFLQNRWTNLLEPYTV